MTRTSAPPLPLLTGRSLQVARGGQLILDEVDIDIHAGQVLAVLGPNGAGKSTLLKLLSGEWKPDAGTISFANKPLQNWSAAQLGKRRAFLHQETHLDFAFTVEEVVLLGRTPHTIEQETPHDLELVAQALEAVDALALRHRQYPGLSGGEKQRVQLARALVQIADAPDDNSGRILFLDEPTNNLDLAHQRSALLQARRIAADGVAVVAVLHDLNLALRYADHALLLLNGKVFAHGPCKDVLTVPNLLHVFQTPIELLTSSSGNWLAVH